MMIVRKLVIGIGAAALVTSSAYAVQLSRLPPEKRQHGLFRRVLPLHVRK
jgi:hypothetical protein